MSIVKKLAGYFVRTKQPAPRQVYDFDYRITEKKDTAGNTYYHGEGVLNGNLCVLTECRHTKESYHRRSYYPSNHYRPYVPVYKLEPKVIRDVLDSYGCGADVRASFKDPCKMKETICAVIKAEHDKEKNLNHKRVVSEGSCKCL